MRAQSFAAAVLLLTVAGCAGNQGTQPQSGDTRFVAGDGRITLFEAADRRPAPSVEGRPSTEARRRSPRTRARSSC